MTDRTWKQVERRVARILGGERVGPTGEASADVLTDWLAVEVKHRKDFPQWLLHAHEQARNASGDGRLGIVVLHAKHSPRAMVVLDLADFAEWFGWNNKPGRVDG